MVPASMTAPLPPSSRLRTSCLFAAVAFAVFVLLPQRTFHGFDTDWYAVLLQVDGLQHPTAHVAYLPLCKLTLGIVRPFGGGVVNAMWLAAALGSAIGVFCLHRAALQLVDAARAIPVVIAVALTPACFYFATAAEIQGVFAAGSGAAWWAFARWRTQRRLVDALALGVVCGAAASIHAFGHLLSAMFVGITLVQRGLSAKVLVGSATVILAMQVATAATLAWLLGHGASGQVGAAAGMLQAWWRAVDLSAVLAVTWREVLFPFMPWAGLSLAGLFVARARPWSLAYLLAVALHAPIACVFLAAGGDHFDERGAYLLPTAVPAVLASAQWLSRRWLWGGIVVAGAIAASLVGPRWAPLYRREFVEAVAQLQHERKLAFLVGPTEIEGVRTHLEGIVCVEIVRSLEAFYAAPATPGAAVPFAPWFDAMLVVLAGGDRTWIVSKEAEHHLAESPVEEVRNLWRHHVPATYELERLSRPGLEGVLLKRRD
jgi:hypothetical protein